MKPRRSKVSPAPLFPQAAVPPAAAAPNPPLPRRPDGASSGELSRMSGFGSPTGASPAGKGRIATDPHGLPVEERVVVEDHITNSGAVVTLTRMDHSGVMRAYRVCRQSHLGAAANTPSWLKLFTANDMVLLALTFAIVLHMVAHGSGVVNASTPSALWWSRDTLTVPESSGPFSAASLIYARLALIVACPLLLLLRLLLALRAVYAEEVLAIRGIGIQFTTYGVFNQVKSKEFVDLRLVRSVVIHDAFWRYQPIFTLSSSIENRGTRIVYFDSFLPRLEVLRPVLCGVRHILFEELEEGLSMSEMEVSQQSMDAKSAASRDTDSAFDDSFTGMVAADDFDVPPMR